MTEPVKLEVTLQLDEHLARFHGYNAEGTEVSERQTLEDIVIGEAARLLVNQAKAGRDSLFDSLTARVRALRDEQIRLALAPVIQEALDGPIQKTNSFGEPLTGQTTTLRDEILTEARSMLKATSVRSDLRSQEASPLQKIIRDEVGSALTKELKAEVDAAKAEVLAAVREKGAEVLASTIASMAGVKA